MHFMSGFPILLSLKAKKCRMASCSHFDADGRIVAIELLDATKHVAAGAKFPTAAE
jgi:hypothetical protein